MPRRRKWIIGGCLVIIACVIAVVFTSTSCPLEVVVISKEDISVVDDHQQPMDVVTLKVKSRSRFSGVVFKTEPRQRLAQIRTGTNWTESEFYWNVGFVNPPVYNNNDVAQVVFLVPKQADLCRMRFEAMTYPWKWRLWLTIEQSPKLRRIFPSYTKLGPTRLELDSFFAGRGPGSWETANVEVDLKAR